MSSMPTRVCLQHPAHAVLEVGRHVPDDAAGPEVAVHHAVAADVVEDLLDVLALAEGVGERRAVDADVGREGADEHVMAGDPVQLGQDDANVLGALRHFQPGQLLDRLAVAQLGVELRQVLRAVLVDQALAIVHRLRQLLGAAVHVADVRHDVDDLLAADGEHHAEDAVSRRVLRPDVDVDIERLQLAFLIRRRHSPLSSPPSPATLS